jgi:hypothetical protein
LSIRFLPLARGHGCAGRGWGPKCFVGPYEKSQSRLCSCSFLTSPLSQVVCGPHSHVS